MAQDPATGRFVVEDLAPGTYSIAADWAIGETPRHQYGIVQVASKEDQKINLAERTWHTIKGSAHFFAEGSSTTSLPQTIALEGGADHPGWKIEAPVSPDGSFSFPPVVDGTYLLRTPAGSESYVDSIASSGKTHSGGLLAR